MGSKGQQDPAAAAAAARQLPSKEAGLFRQLAKQYEVRAQRPHAS